MKRILICSITCLCLASNATAIGSVPGDRPGSGEITIDDSPSAVALSADQTTYVPGAVAMLSGNGFMSGESVIVQVLHLDGSAAVGVDHRPWRIAANSDGAFTTGWPVCTGDCVGKALRAVAVGEISGRDAEARFTNTAVASGPPAAPVPSPPGDKPGSGEITIDDTPSAAALNADQTTYFPGMVATLSGCGFLSSEAVSLQVLHQDGSPTEGWDHWPWRIAADQDGAFITRWRVCTDDCVGLVVRAVAVGEISGRSAEVRFTDMAVSSEPLAQPAPSELGVLTFALRQNSPNPFAGSTRIAFALPEMSTVKIRVFDALGHHVATLADGTMGAGRHAVEWSGRGQAAGMYFCRMDAIGSSGSFHQLRRMTLIR